MMQAPPSEQIGVMVVDDSAVVRGLITRWLQAEPDIAVRRAVADGEQALRELETAEVEIVVLDIEMPRMDGLTALPLIRRLRPEVRVIMASTLTERHARATLQALTKGAADYVPKPTSRSGLTAAEEFRRELIEKIRAHAGRATPAQTKAGGEARDAATRRLADDADGPQRARRRTGKDAAPAAALPEAALGERLALYPPALLAIGSSTGGPQALFTLFRSLTSVGRVPVLIAQHMPPTFTRILADHISGIANVIAKEGEDREPVRPGHIYLAPGGRHMRVRRTGQGLSIVLDDGPPVHHCRPAVDVLFESLAKAAGVRTVAVVLTGMGRDGCDGAGAIRAAGGTVVIQDRASSVVWGMPGAVADAGHQQACYAIDKMAAGLDRLFAARPMRQDVPPSAASATQVPPGEEIGK